MQQKARFSKPKPTAKRQSNDVEEEASSESDVDEVSEEEDENDPDIPRTVKWDEEDNFEQEPPRSVKNSFNDVSFGAILKAKKRMAELSDSDSDSDSASGSSSQGRSEDQQNQSGDSDTEDDDEGAKFTKKPKKRSNKHAPVELSSKKPVSRKRTVVKVPKQATRDPRFIGSGEDNSNVAFHRRYSFLPELRISELASMKAELKKLKAVEDYDEEGGEERQREMKRLHDGIKRLESAVNLDKRERVEQTALERATAEEKERRMSGKGNFWLKDSARQELLLKARFEAIEASGGKMALRKTMEKRQKKLNQKEKRQRPFGQRPNKRQKIV